MNTLYNNRVMETEEIIAKAARQGAILGKNRFASQNSPKWSTPTFFSPEELSENASRAGRNQAIEDGVRQEYQAVWITAFAQAYSSAYQAEQTAYEMRHRPTQPRQQEEW